MRLENPVVLEDLVVPEDLDRLSLPGDQAGPNRPFRQADQIASAVVAEIAGFPDVVTLDAGGTSTDLRLIEGGKPHVTIPLNPDNLSAFGLLAVDWRTDRIVTLRPDLEVAFTADPRD
jgi:hypothetical protein